MVATDGPLRHLVARTNVEWREGVARLETAVYDLHPRSSVLEFACGTGLWTIRVLRHSERLVAIDSSAEVIELNRRKTTSSVVQYFQADIFSWQPPERYHVVFFRSGSLTFRLLDSAPSGTWFDDP